MPIVRFPYRWSRAPWKNIVYGWREIVGGVRNVFRWIPVIWHDVDFDWEPLAGVMEFKLRRMAAHHRKYRQVSDWKKVSKELEVCAALLHRLRDDNYYEKGLPGMDLAKHDAELVGKIIGRRMRSWWD